MKGVLEYDYGIQYDLYVGLHGKPAQKTMHSYRERLKACRMLLAQCFNCIC